MKNEERDIEYLYRRYSASVFRICRRYTRSDQDAQDMAHEVFMKIQKNIRSFRERCSIFTWIYRITINECMHYLKLSYRKKGTVGLEKIDECALWNGERDDIESKITLERVMKKFDKKTRAIVFLLYYEGLTQEEAAHILDICRSALTKRLSSFMAALSASLA